MLAKSVALRVRLPFFFELVVSSLEEGGSCLSMGFGLPGGVNITNPFVLSDSSLGVWFVDVRAGDTAC